MTSTEKVAAKDPAHSAGSKPRSKPVIRTDAVQAADSPKPVARKADASKRRASAPAKHAARPNSKAATVTAAVSIVFASFVLCPCAE